MHSGKIEPTNIPVYLFSATIVLNLCLFFNNNHNKKIQGILPAKFKFKYTHFLFLPKGWHHTTVWCLCVCILPTYYTCQLWYNVNSWVTLLSRLRKPSGKDCFICSCSCHLRVSWPLLASCHQSSLKTQLGGIVDSAPNQLPPAIFKLTGEGIKPTSHEVSVAKSPVETASSAFLWQCQYRTVRFPLLRSSYPGLYLLYVWLLHL